MPIADRCYHVPTSPGQSVCTCLDALMWKDLLIELQSRRIVELERRVQHCPPAILNIRSTVESDRP